MKTSSLGIAVMNEKIWGYGTGFARPIPPISSLFRRFPENLKTSQGQSVLP